MNQDQPYQSVLSLLRRFAVSAGFGVALVAHAAVNVGDVQLGGFFSQGYLKSTENNYPIDTQDGTADFREMGLNGSANLTSRLRLSAQLFAQTLGKYGHDKVTLDWAVLDYAFRPELGLRVGRLKYPRSLNSDVLDLDVVRPFIFLPQSIYDARLRDYQKSFDGGMAYGSLAAGQSTFDYKVFYGKLPMRTDSGVADFFNTSSLFANPPGIYTLNTDRVYGGSFVWGTPVTGLRFGLNYSRVPKLSGTGPFKQVPSLITAIDLTALQYENAFVEYARGPWTFTSEYLLQKSNTTVVLPAALRLPPTLGKYAMRSYYFSAARRLGERVEVGAYYTVQHNGYPSAAGPQNHRRDFTVAVRYDYSEHLLFKLEAHSIGGTEDMFNVPGIVNAPADLKSSMTLFAAKTTLSF